MIRIDFKEYRKYIVVAIIILTLYLAYLIVKPILIPILTGGVLAYIFYPLYKLINKKIKIKAVSAALISFLIILLVFIPGFFLVNAVSGEIYQAYILGKQRIGVGLISECINKDTGICNIVNLIRGYTSEPRVQFYLDQGLGKLSSNLAETLTSFVFSIPKRILEIFIAFFIMYYLFKDGGHITERIERLLPVDRKHQEIIIQKSKNITYGVIYGAILVALIQGALGALGFYIFGISTPIFWGILMAFCAIVPVIGTALVWFPAALIMLIQGYMGAGSIFFLKGIGLIIYGVLIVSSIDNVIKPRIIAGRTKVHPIIILMGVIGGIALLGFIGALIGPLLLSLLVTIAEIYEKNGV